MEYSQILKSCKSPTSQNSKADKEFAKKLVFKDIKFPKLKKPIPLALVFLAMKNIQSMCQKKCCEETC